MYLFAEAFADPKEKEDQRIKHLCLHELLSKSLILLYYQANHQDASS